MKRTLVIALLAIGLVASVSAQAPSASVTEMQYFTIESSLVMGYSLAVEDITAGSSFLLNFTVADDFTFGVQTMKLDGAATAISSMKLGYYLNDMLGFSATFGGDGNAFRTKRGIEKTLFYATIVLSILFLGSGIARIVMAR